LQINGILFPTQGSVRIGETTLSKRTAKEIRKRVGFLFQNPDDQIFMPTVFEDVAFGPLHLGWELEEVEQSTIRALERVNCLHLKDRPPHKLSEGQKRCVSIAAVISMDPDILIMDEPSANLDPRSRRQLIQLVRTFEHSKILATHDLDMILELCQRTIIINAGRVAADGPTPELLSDEELLEKNGLEKPLSLQRPALRVAG
jgi:cobalt/nickel transport system ATP-binding protein